MRKIFTHCHNYAGQATTASQFIDPPGVELLVHVAHCLNILESAELLDKKEDKPIEVIMGTLIQNRRTLSSCRGSPHPGPNTQNASCVIMTTWAVSNMTITQTMIRIMSLSFGKLM